MIWSPERGDMLTDQQRVRKDTLVPIILKALEKCKRTKPKKEAKNTFPTNPGFDEECKLAKRKLRMSMNKESKKEYEELIRGKKEAYVRMRRLELITLGKQNPQKFWKELQQKRKAIVNNITGTQWLEYTRMLYECKKDNHKPPIIQATNDLFTMEDIFQGIKKLAGGKAQDIDGLQAEHLEWGNGILVPHIYHIFNDVIKKGFLENWTTSMVMLLHKNGVINNPSNYRTIMINPLLGKLFGSMVERKISKWEGKRAKGQVGFKPKNSTVDHGVSPKILG
jgi:hypothetical protein